MAMSTYLATKHLAGLQPLDKMKILPSVETFTMKKSDFGRLHISRLHLNGQFIDTKWAFRSTPMLVLPYTQFITITRVSLWENPFPKDVPLIHSSRTSLPLVIIALTSIPAHIAWGHNNNSGGRRPRSARLGLQ